MQTWKRDIDVLMIHRSSNVRYLIAPIAQVEPRPHWREGSISPVPSGHSGESTRLAEGRSPSPEGEPGMRPELLFRPGLR